MSLILCFAHDLVGSLFYGDVGRAKTLARQFGLEEHRGEEDFFRSSPLGPGSSFSLQSQEMDWNLGVDWFLVDECMRASASVSRWVFRELDSLV